MARQQSIDGLISEVDVLKRRIENAASRVKELRQTSKDAVTYSQAAEQLMINAETVRNGLAKAREAPARTETREHRRSVEDLTAATRDLEINVDVLTGSMSPEDAEIARGEGSGHDREHRPPDFTPYPGGATQPLASGGTIPRMGIGGKGGRDGDDGQRVSLVRGQVEPTADQPLWPAIRNRTTAIGFIPYRTFIDQVMCFEALPENKYLRTHRDPNVELRLPFVRADAYTRLKIATELFLMQECGVVIEQYQTWNFPEDPDLDDPFHPDDEHKRPIFEAGNEATRLGRKTVDADGLMTELRQKYLADLGGENGAALPYFELIRQKLAELPLKSPRVIPPNCYGILKNQATRPCFLELIWSFWHEAGYLTRAMYVINRRFQNIRAGERDPLMRFDSDPLRPLNNLLWGYIQDEQHRLTVQRRVYEYDHHYGLRLQNRATSVLNPVDSRSKFIEAFHNLLYLTSVFYKEDDDTTVIADAFRVLNALREVHLLLAEGAHNQFGDLPWTARSEMLMEQWLLARPEMREFLGGRVMVPYAEAWMDRVDTMKTLQGWGDVTVTHFHDLATCGEQLLLSIRYGNWSAINLAAQAANWARYWRPEIQRYIHAYQAVVGVDLAIEPVDTTSPADLLRQRALARVR